MPFWQFLKMGQDGHALLVRPSRIPHRNWKILFVLGSYESLKRLKSKIREAPFFKVQSGKIKVWTETSTFGLGPIPKPKLSDTYGQYSRQYRNHILNGEFCFQVKTFSLQKYGMTSMSMSNSTFDFANTCTFKSRSAKFIIKQSNKQYLALN